MKRLFPPVLVGAIAVGLTIANASAQSRPALPFTLSKETTVIVSPLDPDGTPDYIGGGSTKNMARDVTPENNGFALYLQAVGSGDKILSPKTRALLRLVGAKTTPPVLPCS